jgi:hypothetical protein
MLEDVKSALGITTTFFDAEITANIQSALIDLTIGDIDTVNTKDPLIVTAVKTYCGMMHNLNHGSLDKYDALKEAYEIQKKQLGMKTGYTEWT